MEAQIKEVTTEQTVTHNNPQEYKEIINNVQTLLIIVTVKVAALLVFKVINLCKKAYSKHNKQIISRHESTSRL